MTRYKGRPSKQQLGRDYPHQVEIGMPPGGLRDQLHVMHNFCAGRPYTTCGANCRADRDAMRWCFAHAADAVALHTQFGGERIAEPRKPRDRRP